MNRLADTACAAPTALVTISTFPSANALGYLLNAPPALLSVVLSTLDRPKFCDLTTPQGSVTIGLAGTVEVCSQLRPQTRLEIARQPLALNAMATSLN